jgi:hypothetical protein
MRGTEQETPVAVPATEKVLRAASSVVIVIAPLIAAISLSMPCAVLLLLALSPIELGVATFGVVVPLIVSLARRRALLPTTWRFVLVAAAAFTMQFLPKLLDEQRTNCFR